jgi:hypothetical protein
MREACIFFVSEKAFLVTAKRIDGGMGPEARGLEGAPESENWVLPAAVAAGRVAGRPAATARPGFGLCMMRQRARAWSGRMTVMPPERGGTEIEAGLR